MKKLFLALILVLLSGALCAQDFLQVKENGQTKASLDGLAEVVFVSKNGKLIVESSNSNDVVLPRRTRDNGDFIYVVQVVLRAPGTGEYHRDRKFVITQKNTAFRQEVSKKSLKADNRYEFVVTDVELPIMLKDNTRPTDAHLYNNEACVEIHSMVPSLHVSFNNKLGVVKKERSASGAYITSVVIGMSTFTQLKNDAEQKRADFEALDRQLQTQADVSQNEWAQLDNLKAAADNAEAEFAEITNIAVSAEGSNVLNIDVSGISNKQKLVYEVVKLDKQKQISGWVYTEKKSCRFLYVGLVFPSAAVTSSGLLTSPIDHGVSDMEDGAKYEQPEYTWNHGYSFGGVFEMPLFNKLFLSVGADVDYYTGENQFENHELYLTNNEGVNTFVEQKFAENYTFIGLTIPVALGFYIPVSNDFSINLTAGIGAGIGMGFCKVDGTINTTLSGTSTFTDKSTLTGTYNLTTGNYNLEQHVVYCDGETEDFAIKGSSEKAPYNLGRLSLQLGVRLDYKTLMFGVNYRRGLSNIANQDYWANDEGGRLGGLFLYGEHIPSYAGVPSYKQRQDLITLFIGFRF